MDDLQISQTPLCHCNTEQRLNFKLLGRQLLDQPGVLPSYSYARHEV